MKKWQKKEKQDEDDFNGKRTPRSGGFWGFKGDITSREFLIESKHTTQKGFRITEELWDKIYDEALKSRKKPLISLQINDTEMVILDKDDFLELYDIYTTRNQSRNK